MLWLDRIIIMKYIVFRMNSRSHWKRCGLRCMLAVVVLPLPLLLSLLARLHQIIPQTALNKTQLAMLKPKSVSALVLCVSVCMKWLQPTTCVPTSGAADAMAGLLDSETHAVNEQQWKLCKYMLM